MEWFCNYCNKSKPVEEFYNWYKSRCKLCHSKIRPKRGRYNGSSIVPHLNLELTQRDVGRFWSKVKKKTTNECWLWIGHASAPPDRPYSLYGRFKWHDKDWYAHKFLAEILWGEIPKGYNVDHTCKTKLCVNPNHLEIVTFGENIKRSKELKENCIRSHPFDSVNERWTTNKTGKKIRHCKACALITQRIRYHNKKKARELGSL